MDCDLQLNFYTFDKKPNELTKSVDARISPTKSKNQIISGDNIKLDFPDEGIFISTKILSPLSREDKFHMKIYLTEKYKSQKTFIRGSVYGEDWVPLSKLRIESSEYVNACYGLVATK